MEGKEAIINSIITSAEITANGIVKDANVESELMLSEAEQSLKSKYEQGLITARADGEELVKRRMTLCELDERKAILTAKQKVIDGVYLQTISKILNMTDHFYRDFIGGIIEKYAEDGDILMITQRDAKRLHKDWLDGICKKMNIHIALSDDFIPARGGVVLCGKKYDKNLTLDAMVSALRRDTESAVAHKLFDK